MNAAAKKLLDEIDTLLSLSSNFAERYNELQRTIKPDLYEDLLFFIERYKHVFNSVKKSTGKIQRIYTSHIAMGFHKSQIDTDFAGDIAISVAELKVLKRQIEGGLLYDISDLIKSQVFSNYLDYAKTLLDEHHREAAAVILGGVLEEELRSLSEKNNLPTTSNKGKPLTIEPMNENLGKADVYKLQVQKQIVVWGDVRNNAAHGRHDQYTEKNVNDMYDFIVTFNY